MSAPRMSRAGGCLGIELEMAIADTRTGHSRSIHRYFDVLTELKKVQNEFVAPVVLHGCRIGVDTVQAECGLDNGFNLLETSLKPVVGGAGGLTRLAQQAHRELDDTLHALGHDGLTVLNVAQHPACRRDLEFYKRTRVPRPIYDELVEYRGWAHWEGIDAKAQNGANTSIPIEHAVQALNVVIGLAAATIAIFANSPLESGQPSGLKETRLTLWPRVFATGRFPADTRMQQFPARPFRGLRDYFCWMFGVGTVSRALPRGWTLDYKSTDTVILEEDPCLSDFLRAPHWNARSLSDGRLLRMKPEVFHFIYSQIAAFLDARFRYRLSHLPTLQELLAAWEHEGGLERLFRQHGVDCYIEGRAAGANFADRVLLTEAGEDVAHTVVVGPSAMQLGLLGNLSEAQRLVESWGWARLGRLRTRAIRHGLDDAHVYALCKDVLHVARRGLPEEDRRWLRYPDYVLQSRRSAADRLLATWHDNDGRDDVGQRLQRVVQRHAAIVARAGRGQ